MAKQVLLRVDSEIHRLAKIQAAVRNMTMAKYFELALIMLLKHDKVLREGQFSSSNPIERKE